MDENGKIEDAKFKTFGCGSAIAASSLATDWITGKSISEAGAISNVDIVEELSLPPVKIHCSVLAEDAIKAAIDDYKNKQINTKQHLSPSQPHKHILKTYHEKIKKTKQKNLKTQRYYFKTQKQNKTPNYL